MKKNKKLLIFIFLMAILVLSQARRVVLAKPLSLVINVNSTAQLSAALSSVQPGDTIQLADGTYTGNFVAAVSGTSNAPITLQGSRLAILNGNSLTSGYVLHLNGVNYWKLIGFTVTNGQKGIMTDNANYNLIDNVKVYNIGYEAVHFRTFSSYNTIQNSLIYDTGMSNTSYGEGVYLGSANSNWGTYTGGLPDTSNYNRVLNNTIGPNVSAEAVDIKEGTTGGEVSGNYFDSAGLSGANSADSWVDVKGNDYLISGNTGVRALLDGFQTHIQLSGWGDRNIFRGNHADVQSTGYGFKIQTTGSQGTANGNIVYDDNIVTNATAGVANIPLTPSGGSGLTSTPTKTPTPSGPTRTPTQPAITLTATRTATRLTVSPTVTPTRTRTPAGTMTSTRTPTLTVTVSSGMSTCSPVTSTITAPFTFDGAGTFCWQSSNLGSHINSWNTASVTINGINISNVYIASGSYPAKIGGFWYVTYNSTVTFGHFEAK